jgi:hypothetical protein
VFNDQWEVVALHRAGVPRTDDEGNWLKADGNRWHPADGDDAVEWLANEGVRVSVLLRDVHARTRATAERAVLAELGPQASPVADGVISPAEAPARPRPAAARLVFLHGRGQAGKDPDRLRAGWAAGLARGLALAGRPPVDAAGISFPFYGDTLTTEGITALDGDAAEALAPVGPSARSRYESLIAEAAARAGRPAGIDAAEEGLGDVVGRLQRQLSWLAARSGLDELIIAAVFRDVAAYLDQPGVRDRVLDTVLAGLPGPGRIVLVSHSLGTVVAMDLLTRLPHDVEVVQLVTAGSPLGLDTVFTRLLAGGPKRPDRVGEWVNAWCPADAVAVGCPLTDDWGDGVTELVTGNPPDRAHDIAEYLADPRLAASIAAHLAPA